MDWAAHLDTAAVAAVVGGVSGWFVPWLIGRVPEPEAEADTDDPDVADESDLQVGAERAQEDPDEKVPYAEIAAAPGLAWRCAVAGAVAGALIGLSLGWTWPLVMWLPLVPVGLALAVIDWRTQLLPTWLIARAYAGLIVLALVGALVTGDWHDLVRAGIGWVAAGLVFFLLWFVYPKGLGYGDVRLSGVLGIALGYVGTAELVVGVYGGFLLGGVGGGLLSLLRIVERRSFPFGPFMLVGALLGLVTGGWFTGLVTG